jgi:MFS family permease
MTKRTSLHTFYTLIVTQTFSLIGSSMTSLAVAIKVYKDTDQATPLTMAAFFAALPALLSSSLAGVLADRWDRRRVMALADTGQALGTLLLLFTFATGIFEVWHLYVVALIQAVFGALQGPAFQAASTMLVPDEHRDRANAIRQLTGPMAGIIAPVLAGLLFVVIGAVGVMAIDLLTFAVAVAVVLVLEIPHPEKTIEGRAFEESGPRAAGFLAPYRALWHEVTIGFRFLVSRRILLLMSLYVSLVNFLIGGAFVLNTPYVLSITGSSAALGTLMAITSLGAILGGVIMGTWGGTRPRIHTIMPGIALSGLCLALYGVSRSTITMGAAMFMLMLPIPMINASFMSIMQIKIPPDLQGRVFAALGQLAIILNPLAFLIAGPLADRVFEPAVGGGGWDRVAPLVGSHEGAGIGLIMLLAGCLITLVTLLVYTSSAVRSMEITLPDYEPVAAEAEVSVAHTAPALAEAEPQAI